MKVSFLKTRNSAQLAAWLLAAGSYAPNLTAEEATSAIIPDSTYAFLDDHGDAKEAAMAVSKEADKAEVEVQSESGTIGLAGVLPKKVIRIQLPFISYSGNEGFDEDGNKEKLGIDVNINATAFALQYGVTDKFTFGFGIPYVYKNKMTIDRANLRENNYSFKREFRRYLGAVANVFLAEGQCPNFEACLDYASDPGTTLPSNREITLTTGETVVANSTEAPLVQIDNLLYRPIVPLDGETGIGDVQFGGAYSLVQADNYRASFGASIKLPTGAFEKVPRGRRAIGGGVTDLVTSLNVDYNPVPSVVLSASFQAEMMLASGTKYKNSGIFNDKINEADPSSPGAIAIGSDGKPNKQKFERAGVGRTYQARVGYSAKSLGGFLAPFGLSLSYQSYEDRETRYDGEAFDSSGLIFDFIKENTSMTTGISWSGLDNDPLLPITVSFDYTQFLSGKYMAVAPTGTNFTLSGFYKF